MLNALYWVFAKCQVTTVRMGMVHAVVLWLAPVMGRNLLVIGPGSTFLPKK
jgi:hypothetical protein